jgi:putative PEP-CTERM system TPR-repeat lipoprotein
MKAILRNLPVLLFISCLLLGCGDELTSDDYLNNANEYISQRKFPEAIIELKNALRADDSNGRARAALGNLYFDRGFFADSDKELSRALSSGMDPATVIPTLAQVLVGLGEFKRLEELPLEGLDSESRSTLQAAKGLAKLMQNDPEAAAELIDAAAQNEPSSPYAQVAAARLLMVKGDSVAARKQLKSVFAIAPKYAPAWTLLGDIERAENHPEAAEKAYTRAVNLSRSSFAALLSRAMVRIDVGNYEDADLDLTLLEKGYGEMKEHPGVQLARGIVYLQSKQVDQAIESFKAAAEYPDGFAESLYYLALIYAEKGQTEQALSNINRFLVYVPDNAPGAKLAAKLELGKENFRNAERLLLPVVAQNKEDIEALNLLANARLAQGNIEAAVELLAKIVKLKPKSNAAKARLGSAYLAGGSEELGIKTLKSILVKDPTYDEADALIVMHYLGQDQVAKAIKAAQAYVERNPSARSYVLLARTYLANSDRDQAKGAFEKAMELEPGDPVAGTSLAEFALAVKNYDSAREYYKKVLEHHPEHMETRLKVAATFAMEGRDQDMLDNLDASLLAYPRAMEPRLVKARYFIAKGETEKAIPLLEALSDKQKAHPDALETLATFELATSRFNQAVVTISRLVDTDPNVAEYHYMKSRAYAGLGDQEKSASELDRTLELDPDHFNAKVAVARLALGSNDSLVFENKLAELKKVAPDSPDVVQLEVAYAYKEGDHKHAAQLLEGLFERQPTTSNVIALATLMQSVGDVNGAIAQLQRWLEKNPTDVDVREQLAQIYGGENQVEDVIFQCREILKVEPDNIVALNNLAWHLVNDEPKQALAYAKRAVELSPESSSILDTLAMAQLRNNDITEARQSIDRALAASPKSPEIRFHEAQIRAAEGDKNGAIVALNALLNKEEEFLEREDAKAFLKELQSRDD